jgi:hypothetical protein
MNTGYYVILMLVQPANTPAHGLVLMSYSPIKKKRKHPVGRIRTVRFVVYVGVGSGAGVTVVRLTELRKTSATVRIYRTVADTVLVL